MTFSTGRFALASTAVCAHEGADLPALSDAALVAVTRDIGEARRALDVLAAEVAGLAQSRADASPGPGGIARRVGYRNVKQFVADTLGSTGGEVHRQVAVGKALAAADAAAATPNPSPDAPRTWALVAAAVRVGDLTVEKADILIGTLERLGASVEAERQFVALAKRLRPYDLRSVCAREVALGDPATLEQREARQYRDRELNFTERMDGMTVVNGLLDPASAGHVRAWFDAQVTAGFQARREVPGDTRSPGQMRVDALVMLARHGLGCNEPGSGAKTVLVLRSTVDEIKKGLGTATCDSIRTPISIGTLRTMAADAGVLPVVMGGDSVPLDVGRVKRLATPYQRAAVLERDGGCAWCHAPASYCDIHHIIAWEFGGRTDLDNLVSLCVSCHHSVHFGGWVIEVDDGVVWFTPPASFDPNRTKRKGGLADLVLAA